MELSEDDIDLLQRFHKQKTTYRFNKDIEEIYGQYYLDRVSTLQREGYIRITSAEDSLHFLKTVELKEILRQHGQKVSGKKQDLVDRIQENVPVSEYENVVSKIWYLTKKGTDAVNSYLHTNNERYLNKSLENKDWGLVRNAYLGFGQMLLKEKKYDEALPFFLLVKYFDYSGLDNNNSVAMYEDMSWVSSTSIAYTIEKCLRQSTLDLDTAFQKAIDMCPIIPFHYFAKGTVLEIIKKEIEGYEFIPSDYKNLANSPSLTATDYQYYDFNNLDKTFKAVDIGGCNNKCYSIIEEQKQDNQDSSLSYTIGVFLGKLFAKIVSVFKGKS